MSRKDFIKLAAVIREILETPGNEFAAQRFAEATAQICQHNNKNFNRQKFMNACGLEK